ncbi:12201_t:CDS:2, partial [Dentiscutata erythropus]
MRNLIHKLLSAFQNSNEYNQYQNPLWNTTSPNQFTAASIAHLYNCFPDGVLRIENIFSQDITLTQKTNLTSQINVENSGVSNQINFESEQQTQIDSINIIPQENLITDNLNDQERPTTKKLRQARRETKPEEKRILEPLINCLVYPTIDQINQVKEILGNEWDKNRISQYISRHRK